MFRSWSSSSSSSEENKSNKKFNLITSAAAAQRAKVKNNSKSHLESSKKESDIYESFSNPKYVLTSKPKSPPKRKSRYISKLVETANRRKEESQQIIDKQRIEQEKQQQHKYQNKPQFITSGYKKKLQSQANQLKQDKQDEQNLTKHGMDAFYQNLVVGQNVAMGGDTDNTQNNTQQHIVQKNKKREKTSRFTHVNNKLDTNTTDTAIVSTQLPDEIQQKKKIYGLRRNDQKSIEAYRQRYLQRKAAREAGQKTQIPKS